jgi:transcriptional regulator with XRE-family HTH domain
MPPRTFDRFAAEGIEPIDRHLAERLESTRRWRRLSRAALAKEMGISEPQLTKLERGQNRIFSNRLYAAALALGVTPGWFFDEFDADGGRSGATGAVNEPASFRPPGLSVEEQILIEDYRRITDAQRRLVRQMVDHLVAAVVPAPAPIRTDEAEIPYQPPVDGGSSPA